MIRNSDIQGVNVGIDAPSSGFGPGPNLSVENSYLRNQSNVVVPTLVGQRLLDGEQTGRDPQHAARGASGQSLSVISMAGASTGAIECLNKLNEVRVYAHNGIATDNFQVYHTNSSVLPRPPGSCTPTTRPGIAGLTCPIAPLGPVLTAPAAPTNLRVVR